MKNDVEIKKTLSLHCKVRKNVLQIHKTEESEVFGVTVPNNVYHLQQIESSGENLPGGPGRFFN